MPVVNNNKRLLDLPSWSFATPYPAATAAGVCMTVDKRPGSRYAYLLIAATSFWRYDLWADTYQQLASPPGGTVGNGTALCYDPTFNSGAGGVWALIANATAPVFYVYDVASNTWSTAKSVVNLPATVGTDAALCHTDSSYNASGNDDFIYLVANATAVVYRYSISGNAWIATLTAIPAATGAGCSLHWLPTYDTNKLICIRGAASNNIYEYNISGNSWASVTYQPTTETFTSGTMACIRGLATSKILIQKDATMRVYELTMTAPGVATLIPLTTQNIASPGAATTGDRFFVARDPELSLEYLYLGLPTSSALMRAPLFF